MNAISFLINEHNRVRKIFKQLTEESHREATKEKMFSELSQDLIRHEKMEQSVWYPRLKKYEELQDIIPHLISEEKDAEKTIKKINKTKSTEEWHENIAELKEEVEHHAREEETKLFPQVQKVLSEDELKQLGREMEDFKKAYISSTGIYKMVA